MEKVGNVTLKQPIGVPMSFIKDLCAISNGGEFGKWFCNIWPKELTPKVEKQGDHATILNLDVTIKEVAFIHKLFHKTDSFPFPIVRVPHIESKISKIIFSSAIRFDFQGFLVQLYVSETIYLRQKICKNARKKRLQTYCYK